MSASVAIVIPSYNVEPFIGATLKSVFAQTVPADEVIVVDNGSTDKTVEVVHQFPIRFFVEIKKRGAAVSRNRGIREAQCEWIAFLDGDDQFFPDKIKNLKEAIEASPDAVMFAHDEIEGPVGGPFVEKKLHEYYNPLLPALPQLFERCFLSTSTIAVRRDILIEVGGFNEEFILSQDYELWMRVIQKGALRFIPKTLALYLLRANSNSENIPLRHHFVMRIIDRYRPQVSKRLYRKRVFYLFAETIFALIQKHRWILAFQMTLRLIASTPGILIRRLK